MSGVGFQIGVASVGSRCQGFGIGVLPPDDEVAPPPSPPGPLSACAADVFLAPLDDLSPRPTAPEPVDASDRAAVGATRSLRADVAAAAESHHMQPLSLPRMTTRRARVPKE